MDKECLLGRSHQVNNPRVHTQAEQRVYDGCPCTKTWHIRAVQILAGHPQIQHSSLVVC